MIAPAKSRTVEVPTTVACDHCGLPAPKAEVGPSFCCDGCRGAYALIHEWKLEEFYALREQLGARSSRPSSDREEIALLDNRDVLGESLRVLNDGRCSVVLGVDGVHCAACAWLIERAVPLVNGWDAARVNLPNRSVEIVFAPERTKLSTIGRTLNSFGYRLRPRPVDDADVDPDRASRLRNIAIAGFCFANAMWISVALYAGADGQHGRYLSIFGTLLAALAVLGPGQTFLRSAWASLRTRTPHIDLPVSVGLLAGLVGSLVHLFTGAGDTYADSLCGLVFFLLLGRELQARGQQKAASAVRALASLRPPLAHRVVNDPAMGEQIEVVRACDLIPGDVVEIAAGETVPVDGVVVAGHSLLDQSILTGESRPVEATLNTPVSAGVVNVERTIRVRAEATANKTRVAAISRLVEQSLSNRTPLVQTADHIGAVFVVAVLLLAVVTFVIASTTVSPLDAGQRAVALLVVACPCALALATPLAIGVAVGRAAKRGILIRRGDVFEQMQTPGTIWFDKTGTLTEGRPILAEWHGSAESLSFAAAVEHDSKHPIAECLRSAVALRDLEQFTAENVIHDRRGVCGKVNGRVVAVGSRSFMEQRRISIAPAEKIHAENFAASGLAPNFVAIDNEVEAVFAIGDQLRPEAQALVQKFRSAGWVVGMLSGDHADVVTRIASNLGISRTHAFGELTPEEKLAIVENERPAEGPVVFVGDGVNDAAALAAVDVGIATSGAAEASLQAASVYCTGTLDDVGNLLNASHSTVQAIYRLLGVSLAYNVIAGAAAVAGLITPLIAAVLMPISSLTVSLLAFSGRTFHDDTVTHSEPLDVSTVNLKTQETAS